ncbi:MAG: hypothetical protein IKE21_09740 [Erysipelotrichaceae bacterium]|nr:hypothetical protein [Erysipelotrichaceae bacterium]
MRSRPDWWVYAEFYPEEGEKGYDPKKRGLKGLREDAPERAKKEYEKDKEYEEKIIL